LPECVVPYQGRAGKNPTKQRVETCAGSMRSKLAAVYGWDVGDNDVTLKALDCGEATRAKENRDSVGEQATSRVLKRALCIREVDSSREIGGISTRKNPARILRLAVWKGFESASHGSDWLSTRMSGGK